MLCSTVALIYSLSSLLWSTLMLPQLYSIYLLLCLLPCCMLCHSGNLLYSPEGGSPLLSSMYYTSLILCSDLLHCSLYSISLLLCSTLLPAPLLCSPAAYSSTLISSLRVSSIPPASMLWSTSSALFPCWHVLCTLLPAPLLCSPAASSASDHLLYFSEGLLNSPFFYALIYLHVSSALFPWFYVLLYFLLLCSAPLLQALPLVIYSTPLRVSSFPPASMLWSTSMFPLHYFFVDMFYSTSCCSALLPCFLPPPGIILTVSGRSTCLILIMSYWSAYAWTPYWQQLIEGQLNMTGWANIYQIGKIWLVNK